jgi:hypothetical protein
MFARVENALDCVGSAGIALLLDFVGGLFDVRLGFIARAVRSILRFMTFDCGHGCGQGAAVRFGAIVGDVW